MAAKEPPWMSLAGIVLGPDDFLLELKAGEARLVASGIGVRLALAKRAQDEGISVSRGEITEALAEFYGEHELFEESEIKSWLKQANLTDAAVRVLVRQQLLADRCKDKLAPQAAIDRRFQQNRANYSVAHIEAAACRTEGTARELIISVRERELEWPGGESRELSRAETPEEIAAALFSSEPGSLHGPLDGDDGFEVWRLVKHQESKLDDDLSGQIREEIVQEAVQLMLAKDPVKFLR